MSAVQLVLLTIANLANPISINDKTHGIRYKYTHYSFFTFVYLIGVHAYRKRVHPRLCHITFFLSGHFGSANGAAAKSELDA